jgi:hypothetical protein
VREFVFMMLFCSAVYSQSLNIDQPVYVKEGQVKIDGVEYKMIEYRKRRFYFRASAPTEEGFEFLCGQPVGAKSQTLLEASITVTKRSIVFVEGLEMVCQNEKGGKRQIFRPSAKVGVTINEKNNTKIFVDILQSLSGGISGGFSSEF